MKEKLFSGIALTAVVGLLLVFASPSYRQGEPTIAGARAPEFNFTLAGKPARLSDLRGKVVVLNFWATWCPPCVEEMPSLNALHARLASQGVVVLGISVDESDAAYQKFLADHHITFPTYRDPVNHIAPEYGTTKYPETYIIGRDGRFARKIIGPQDWARTDLLEFIQSLAKN